MPAYSFEQVPKEILELLLEARKNSVSPIDVCKELTRLEVPSTLKMLYLRDGLGISLERAKEVVLQCDYGSVSTWANQLIADIKHLNDPDDS
ncbi:MAG: hypothetical protein ACJ74W_10150 [Pyrinomonadaceae bacterium]